MPDDSEVNNSPIPLTKTLVPIAMAPHLQSALISQVSEPQLPHSYPAVTMPYPPPQARLPLPSSDVAAAASGFISPSTSIVRLVPLTSKSAAAATPSTVNQAPFTPLSESAAAAALSTSILPLTSTNISTTLGSSAAAAVPVAVSSFRIRIPRPTIAPPQPPGLPVTKDLEMLESRNDIAPNQSNCDTDTNSVTPGHQPTLDSMDSIRPRRTRKVNILNLNACICGVTITEHEIQNSEAVMKCRVLGCETVWVSELWLLSEF